MPSLPTMLIATTTATPPPRAFTAGDVAGAAEHAADKAVALLEALPGEAHITMGVALLAGLALWLWGAKLIKPMFGLLGVAAGGLVGLLLPPLLGIDQVGDVAAWLVGLGVGAVIGLVVAMVLLKIAVTFAAGLAFAVAGFLGGLVYLQHAPLPPVEPAEGAAPRAALVEVAPTEPAGPRLYRDPLSGGLVTLHQLVERSRAAGAGVADDAAAPAPLSTEEQLLLAAARVRAVLTEAQAFAEAEWNALPVRDRTVLLLSTAGAFGAGLLAGLLLPRRSAALVTALLGSAVWLTAAVWLVEGLPQLEGVRPYLAGKTPRFWAIVWVAVAAVGLMAQVAGLGRARSTRRDDRDED